MLEAVTDEATAGAAGVRWPAHLRLDARLDAGRQGGAHGTLLHAAHEGPLRLLKTLYPEGPRIAHAVVLHPPGGLVGGDRLEFDVQVHAGAHLLVTSPAAARFYRSTAGAAAQRVQARVAPGARLEWLPQETLAYDGCDAHNAWQVRLEGDASLMAMELLALGLGESGRPFRHGRFVQQFEIEGDTSKFWRERGVIDAHDAALLDGPCGLAGFRATGMLVLAQGDALDAASAEAALELARAEIAPANATTLLAGATLLHGRLLLLRVLAHEVEPAMRLLRRVRGLWRQRCWGLAANEPRIWAS